MEYYEHIVSNRHSCRSFSKKKIGDDVLNSLIEYYNEEVVVLDDDIQTELKFYFGHVWEKIKGYVGYHGLCIKAPTYLVLYSDKENHYLENAGFIAQGLTLKMTELGLAACWQTVLDADAVKNALGEDTDMTVACVIAFGYKDPKSKEKPVPKKSLEDLVYGPKYGQETDTGLFYRELEDALRAAAKSQSLLNLQPYKLLVDTDQISLVGIPDEATTEEDKHLNYGILMFNFFSVLWATREAPYNWSFEPVTDRDLALPDDVTYVAKFKL